MAMNPLHFAVVVGIKSYPGISDLQSALGDAEAFCQWLQTDGGVPPENIKLIHVDQKFDDPIAAKPSRDDINTALKQVNASVEAKIKDAPLDWEKTRLYFYVSGHGIAPTAGETALLLANASEGNWGENIACRSYLERYVDCQYFKEVLVFSDCCRNRLAADLGIPPFGRKITRGRVEKFLGYATLLGDAAYEPTEGADPNQARSFFTQALLEGLNGAATDRQTGEINTATLAAYMHRRVVDMTSDKRYHQIPEFPTDPGRPIILRPATAPILAPPQHTITIVFPADFSGTADLFYSIDRPLGSWKAADGNWVVKLQDGLYEVRPAGENDGSRFQSNGLFKINGGDCYVQL